MVFNASDPSGAGGLAADVTAIASVGAHPLPVVTGAYVRDTAEVFDHFAFDEDAVAEQARTILEDVPVQVIKVGFAGSPETLSTIAEIAADYPDVPVISYMPSLSWWDEGPADLYEDAFRELLLPQTTVLVGNHSTLWRWLLPEWNNERSPSPATSRRPLRRWACPRWCVPLPDQFVENVLATPQTVLASEKFERFDAVFSGAGDTLSAALALVAGADPRPRPAKRWPTSTAASTAASGPAWATWSRPPVLGAESDEGDEDGETGTPLPSTCPRMKPSTEAHPEAPAAKPVRAAHDHTQAHDH